MATATKKGLTTIQWGSGGMLADAAISGAIVESIAYKPANSINPIEDNDGFEVTTVCLLGEWDATIKVLYDSAKTWPAEGSTLKLKSPLDSTGKDCLIVSVAPDVARKREAMLTFEVQYRQNRSLA